MRIAWATPFGSRSAIGRFSRAVAEALAEEHEVEVWYPAEHGADLLPTRLPCRPLRDGAAIDGAYDELLYNMGDHLHNHAAIYEASQRRAGVVVLHDMVLHNFFLGYYLERKKDKAAYLEELRLLHGPQVVAEAEEGFRGRGQPPSSVERVADVPLFERALHGARGVVVHSEFLRRRVRDRLDLPVVSIPLAYERARCHPTEAERQVAARLAGPPGPLLFVTLGHVNANKRVQDVLAILVRDPALRRRIRYLVVGSVPEGDFGRQLRLRCEQADLRDVVTLAGYQPDGVVAALLDRVDAFVNLRDPALEGGSASVVEQLLTGRPVVVTDTGVYADLPDDCVLKVRRRDLEHLDATLRRLADDSTLRQRLGEAGRRYAGKVHSVTAYRDSLTSFLGRLAGGSAETALGTRAARELVAMGGYGGLPSLDRVGQALETVTGGARGQATILRSALALRIAVSKAPGGAASRLVARPWSRVTNLLGRALALPRAVGAIGALVQAQETRLRRLESDLRAVLDLVSVRAPQAVVTAGGVHATRLGDDLLVAFPEADLRAALLASASTGGSGAGPRRLLDATVEPGMSVVDVGAGVGVMAVVAARRVGPHGRVLAFEPDPETFKALRATIAMNDLTGRVEPRCLALGDRAAKGAADGSPARATETLDVIVGEGRVDVLRIGAPGSVDAVLRGAAGVLARSPSVTLLIDFAPAALRGLGLDPGGILAGLEAQGFLLRLVDGETGQARAVERASLEGCAREVLMLRKA